jgi:hypothetical protein
MWKEVVANTLTVKEFTYTFCGLRFQPRTSKYEAQAPTFSYAEVAYILS